jgi:hypothetical protein
MLPSFISFRFLTCVSILRELVISNSRSLATRGAKEPPANEFFLRQENVTELRMTSNLMAEC